MKKTETVKRVDISLTYDELSELIRCIGTAPGFNDERAEIECYLMSARDEIDD